MKLAATRLNEEEYKQVEEYARRRRISVYEAVRELIMLGLTEHTFKRQLLRIIELYARLDSSFRLELEHLLASLEEL